ncbi:GNAT family N-acetyltransferase [Buttiauxella sp. WJP83]|uniref:GNAT family N-acetyltransferase n=1 Tax=Buttiauxella sp. WJP83 TaxID=2986951 RepID=UPI0022DD7B3C|nr:GNAT family N-acetyltransferase [Buttiauxella sp. WJP83]WBM71431.1 GNAT family N-acetyltransferase [Buttiauxella sp. WJP83]
MKILPLYAVPQHAQQVIDWQWQAFGTEDSRDFFASIVATSQREGEMPLTFVAVEGAKLLGTVGLWRCDLISRQDLYPWLAALYIDENQRGRGLGAKLQEHVIQYARTLGYPQLYLYSACKDYYERFGWQYIGDGLDYPNKPVHMYRFIL